MNRYPLRQLLRVLAIPGLLLSGQVMTQAHALPESVSTGPRLVVSIDDPQRGTILLTGEGFTPGGRVVIDVYEGDGLQLVETRWVRASEETFGLNGSRDPALGYRQGGTVSEMLAVAQTVYGPNGSRDPARGYNPGLGETRVDNVAIGPNGSRDPAMIGVPAIADQDQTASICPSSLVVTALDEQDEAWSNMLQLGAGCRTAATSS